MGFRKTYHVPYKLIGGKKAASYSIYISPSQIVPSLVAEFGVRKPSKDWELLIMSTWGAWTVAQEAVHVNNEDIDDNAENDVNSISFLDPKFLCPPRTH